MKKVFLISVVIAIAVISLSSCGLNRKSIGSSSSEDIVAKVNFDLTEYEAYGNLSDGLIWVEKTESSYSKAETTTFAYLDVDGNVKSPWFYSGE